jgi:hypothetical protein
MPTAVPVNKTVNASVDGAFKAFVVLRHVMHCVTVAMSQDTRDSARLCLQMNTHCCVLPCMLDRVTDREIAGDIWMPTVRKMCTVTNL